MFYCYSFHYYLLIQILAFVKTVFDGPCLAKLVFNDICKNWKCEIVCCWHPKVHVLVKCVYKGQMWTFTFVSTHLFTPFSQSWICILSGTMTVRTIYLKITYLHFWYLCVCTFCPGGLSLLGQFAYLWNVIDLIFPEKRDSCSCCIPLPANNLTTLMFAKGSVCVSHCIVHLIMWTSVTRGIRPPLSEHHCCLSGFTVLQLSHSSWPELTFTHSYRFNPLRAFSV